MDWTQAFICITGLIGHLLIARQDKRGYWFWLLGNIAIIKISLIDGRYGMAVLFLVYTFISLQALRMWAKKEEVEHNDPPTKKPLFECLKSFFDSFKAGREEADLTFVIRVQIRG
jgi:nicotinamide riboside transporter PnuC